MENNHHYDKTKKVNIIDEMKKSFLDYSMSVIVSRALPDVRDGLKPVQRRILYAMNDLGMQADKPHKKSARIVGEVMGKYHPHGDSSIYEAMVRMAQPFSYRAPLVDGHGNFGSIDGDGAAAMRYTEARMSKLAGEMVKDIGSETVDFIDNYDSSEQEPKVLPARFPNLLVNGASGIAVGMATNILPHNLAEVIDATIAYIDNEHITVFELMNIIKGPDFPTGGQVLGISGLRDAYESGRGRIAVRSQSQIKTLSNEKVEIIVTEIPYQVNKSSLLARIAEVVKLKIIEGITDLRDESNREGMKIVIELKKDVNPDVTLNNLYKYTQLQQTFNFNMIALVNDQPQMLNLKDLLVHYVDHQLDVVQRRTKFNLKRCEARMHILEALVKALDDVDRCIELIKTSKTPDAARQILIKTYHFSDVQARAILAMQLQRLTGLEIDKIHEEADHLKVQIKHLKAIIESEHLKLEIIKAELTVIKDAYATPRLSEMNLYEDLDIDNEDLIPVEDIMVTITKNGYIKRMPVNEYEVQNRGGVGRSGIKIHDDDFVEHMQMTSTHDFHLFFTNLGRVFKIKGYRLPLGSRNSKGMPIVNFLQFKEGEKLASFTSIKNFDDKNTYLFFTTKAGLVKKTKVSDFKNIRTNGIIAIRLKEDDELFSVLPIVGKEDILLGASNGQSIRFHHKGVRPIGRSATGVIGMRMDKNETIVGATLVSNPEQEILVITKNGFGKRTSVDQYRVQARGGKGVKALNITEAKGDLAALLTVVDDQDLLVVSDKGITIRIHIKNISSTGRAAQGSKIISLKNDQQVSTIALIVHQDVVEEEEKEVVVVEQETFDVEEEKIIIEAANLDIEEDVLDASVAAIVDEILHPDD